MEDYDVVILDREFTIQSGAENLRDDKFTFLIEGLHGRQKGDIVSVCTPEDFITIGKQYSNIPPHGVFLPVNKLVTFKGSQDQYLLRYGQDGLRIFRYDPCKDVSRRFTDETARFWVSGTDTPVTLAEKVDKQFEKPEPIVFKAVMDYNVYSKRAKKKPKVLVVGDMYGADIVAANLLRQADDLDAEISTCLVKSYGLSQDILKHKMLVFTRTFDRFFGNIFSFCSSRVRYSNSWDKNLRYRNHSNPSP